MFFIIYELAHNMQKSEFCLAAYGSKGLVASFAVPYSLSEAPESLIYCRLFKQSKPDVADDDREKVCKK